MTFFWGCDTRKVAALQTISSKFSSVCSVVNSLPLKLRETLGILGIGTHWKLCLDERCGRPLEELRSMSSVRSLSRQRSARTIRLPSPLGEEQGVRESGETTLELCVSRLIARVARVTNLFSAPSSAHTAVMLLISWFALCFDHENKWDSRGPVDCRMAFVDTPPTELFRIRCGVRKQGDAACEPSWDGPHCFGSG